MDPGLIPNRPGTAGPQAIDWQAPWLRSPWAALGQAIAKGWAQGQPLCPLLNAESHTPDPRSNRPIGPRFVPAATLPAGCNYEDFVAESACCPTRENLHDFFNALVWRGFVRSKWRINALHRAELLHARAHHGPNGVRGPVRDALTLFDENGAVLQAPPALWTALHQRDWAVLFGPLRGLWREARLTLFGHALMEKLVKPRKSITAHVYQAPQAIDSIADLDDWLAQDLVPKKLAGKPFAPLPVLGVPQWWAANADPAFYADAQIFRPRRNQA
ncbi:MAG: hypothetical protein Fur007_06880 [Rhodoferax sp.]